MGGSLAPCLSLYFLGLSQDDSFGPLPPRPRPFLPTSGSPLGSLCRTLVSTSESKHPQSLLRGCLGPHPGHLPWGTSAKAHRNEKMVSMNSLRCPPLIKNLQFC